MSNLIDSWPKDMEISVSMHPHRLMELLWVREAYDLHPTAEVPLLADTPDRVSASYDRDAWSLAWDELWAASLRREADGIPADFASRLDQTAPDTAERAELLGTLKGPSWSESMGESTLGEPFYVWSRRQSSATRFEQTQKLTQNPERLSTDEMAHAWRAGLTKVITVPCRGSFSYSIEGLALLITDETRADPARYSSVLEAF